MFSKDRLVTVALTIAAIAAIKRFVPSNPLGL